MNKRIRKAKPAKKMVTLNNGDKVKQANMFEVEQAEAEETRKPMYQDYAKGRPFTIKIQ